MSLNQERLTLTYISTGRAPYPKFSPRPTASGGASIPAAVGPFGAEILGHKLLKFIFSLPSTTYKFRLPIPEIPPANLVL